MGGDDGGISPLAREGGSKKGVREKKEGIFANVTRGTRGSALRAKKGTGKETWWGRWSLVTYSNEYKLGGA